MAKVQTLHHPRFGEALLAHDHSSWSANVVSEKEAEYVQQRLAASATAEYDATQAEHELVLRRLWAAAFGDLDFCNPSPQWASIGFQSNDPRRDLRGSGLQGLEHLALLIESRALPADLPPGFPLALASINVTGFLQYFFGLNRVFPGHSASRAGSTTRQAFFHCVAARYSSVEALQILHDAMVLRLAHTWRRLKEASPSATLMDFPPLLQLAFTHASSVLSAAPRPWTLLDIAAEIETGGASRPISAFARFALMLLCAACNCSWCTTPGDSATDGRDESRPDKHSLALKKNC